MSKSDYPYLIQTLKEMKKNTKDSNKKQEFQEKIDKLKSSKVKYIIK